MGFSLRLHDFLLTQAFLAQGPARTPSHGALEPEKPYALSAHRPAIQDGLGVVLLGRRQGTGTSAMWQATPQVWLSVWLRAVLRERSTETSGCAWRIFS